MYIVNVNVRNWNNYLMGSIFKFDSVIFILYANTTEQLRR